MALAVAVARLYTSEINLALSRAVRSSRPVKLSGPLRQELEHWLFLETWDGILPICSCSRIRPLLLGGGGGYIESGTTGIPVLLGLTLLLRKLLPSTMSCEYCNKLLGRCIC